VNGLRLLTLLCLAAGGCSNFQPYATVPAALPEGQTDPRTRIGICYNTLWTDDQKVQQAAEGECGADMTAERVDTDYRLNACPTLLPGRATFACTPRK